MEEELGERSVQVFNLDLGARRNPLKGWLRMRKVVANFRPELIHAHSARGVILSAFSRVPVIYTHHNSVFKFPPVVMPILDGIADHYTGIGEACAREFRARTQKPITIIRNAAREPRGQPAKRTPHRPLRFCLVGNLQPQKNYGMLIEVVSRLRGQLPQDLMPRFEVAGGGGDLDVMRARANALGVADYVEFLGPTPRPDAIFSRSDILLNCSLWEGLPISMIEAALSGLPIVATRTGDVPMVVSDGINGRLVPPGDADALHEVLLSLVNVGFDFERWSTASRKIGADFSLDRCAKTHLNLYESARMSTATDAPRHT
jgi:glycosyltransferase involved in cell wall biosynthesis